MAAPGWLSMGDPAWLTMGDPGWLSRVAQSEPTEVRLTGVEGGKEGAGLPWHVLDVDLFPPSAKIQIWLSLLCTSMAIWCMTGLSSLGR